MTAIYQRSRPIHWDEVIGQEHVKDVLRPALERGRIGHAYLFSGPRGVGKTTTARLIAMTVNCETPGVKPCGTCDSCKSVIAGRHPDVLEIDAASNNSVDDVRDLREKVALQPMRGDKKVYILDEAHMMSKSAFNALLKTLEEPPSHAVFVLATTEPERLPATILSRCQHYRFRRLSADEIAGKLLKTATSEGVNPSPQALNLIARAADGAMRDGESLLERLLASGEPNLTLEMVEGALGLPPQDRVEALAMSLARGDTKRLMQNLTAFYSDGFAPRTITERVKIALRDQLHAQLGLSKNVSETFGEVHLLRLIRALDEEDGRFARASDLIALEMAFTKAMLAPEMGAETGAVSPALESRVANLEKQVRGAFQKVVDEGLKASGQRPVPEFDPTARAPRRPVVPVAEADEPPFETSPAKESPRAATPQEEPTRAALGGKGWADVILKADLRLRAILKEAVGHLSSDTLVIEYSNPKNKWHAEQVASKLEELAALTQQVLGHGVALELVMPDGTKKNSRTIHNSTTVQPAARVVSAVLEALVSVPTQIEVLPPEPISKSVARVASDLAFDALGSSQAKAGLFSPAEFVAALEPDNVVLLEPDNAVILEPVYDDLYDDAPLVDDDMPLPTEYGSSFDFESAVSQNTSSEVLPHKTVHEKDVHEGFIDPENASHGLLNPKDAPHGLLDPESSTFGLGSLLDPKDAPHGLGSLGSLETFDLETMPDALPLAALEMDFGDLENIAPKKVVSSLAGHPNYGLLNKLFAHRVREVGRLEVKAVLTDETEIVATVVATDDIE